MNLLGDSNFLVSMLSPEDVYYPKAMDTLWSFLEGKDLLVLPQLVLNETVFVLLRNGADPEAIKRTVVRISGASRVRIVHADGLSMLRFCAEVYRKFCLPGANKVTKTNDFIITCLAKEFDAAVITGDKQMIRCLSANGIPYIDFTR